MARGLQGDDADSAVSRRLAVLSLDGCSMILKPDLSPKMQHWQAEAYAEIGIKLSRLDHEKALFPRRFYLPIQSFDHAKQYDFCFVGAFRIDRETESRRIWLLDFIRRNFSERSYLQFTDQKTKAGHAPMGEFDMTLLRSGMVPKELPMEQRHAFDEHYYQVMCRSEFTLCPAGDRPWSMRFYEALMCRSIPILQRRTHHRSVRELLRDYRYYTLGDELNYRPDWVQHNYELFLRHHTLDGREPAPSPERS
jgi:hypothetical protein